MSVRWLVSENFPAPSVAVMRAAGHDVLAIAEQAIEKGLKAWLCAKGVDYPPTHDLARLLTLLEKAGADVEQFWPLVQFTIFAVQARYEDGFADLDEPLTRPIEIENVRALLAATEKSIAPL